MNDAKTGRELARHSLIYALIPFLRYGVSIGMTRAYTVWLLTARYGLKEIVDLWMILAQQLLGQNLLRGVVRIYFEGKSDRERAELVSSTTLILGGVAFVLCALAWYCTPWLTPLLLGSGSGEVAALELEQALKLVLILIPFQLCSLCGFNYIQIQKRSGLYSIVQLSKLALEVGLHIYFMGVLGWGLRGFLLGLIGGEVVTTVALTGTLLVRLGWRVRWSAFAPVLVYAAPLIPTGMLQLGLHQLDRRMIAALIPTAGLSLVGIYGLGYKVGALVNSVLQGSFMQIWAPYVFAQPSGPARAQMVARVSTWAVLAIGAASLVTIVFGRQAVAILGGDPSFDRGHWVIPLVSTGYVFWALYNAASMPLFLEKRTSTVLLLNVLTLCVYVSLNWILIPRLEIVGAALTACVSFAILASLAMWTSMRLTGASFELGRLARTFAVVLITAGGVLAFERGNAPPMAPATLVFKSCLLAAGWLCLARFVLSEQERDEVGQWLRAKLPFLGGRTE